MREQQIQDAFAIWLRERSIPFIRSRMDKRPTIAKGWPDFTIFWCGRAVFVETKTASGKLSEDQKTCIDLLQRNGCRVEIARTVEQCCEAARSILCESGRATDATRSFPDAIREQFAKTKAAVSAIGKDHVMDHGCGCEHCRAAFEESDTPPVNGTTHFIGKLGTVDYLFSGSGQPGTVAKPIRKATPADIAELRRFD